MKKAYMRVYEDNANIEHSELENYGVDKIYEEQHKTGRKKLYNLLNNLEQGDIVIIYRLGSMFNNSQDLISIVNEIRSKGANIKSINDEWLDTTTNNPNREILRDIIRSLNKFDMDFASYNRSNATKMGLLNAKSKGRIGGRPSKRSDKSELIQQLYEDNYKIDDIVEETGLSRATVYRAIKDFDINKQPN